MKPQPFHVRLARARREVAAIHAGAGLAVPACVHRPGWPDQLGAALFETHGHGVRLALRHWAGGGGGAGWASGACPVFPGADPVELTARVMAARPAGPV